jgi:hypothetical protein
MMRIEISLQRKCDDNADIISERDTSVYHKRSQSSIQKKWSDGEVPYGVQEDSFSIITASRSYKYSLQFLYSVDRVGHPRVGR